MVDSATTIVAHSKRAPDIVDVDSAGRIADQHIAQRLRNLDLTRSVADINDSGYIEDVDLAGAIDDREIATHTGNRDFAGPIVDGQPATDVIRNNTTRAVRQMHRAQPVEMYISAAIIDFRGQVL